MAEESAVQNHNEATMPATTTENPTEAVQMQEPYPSQTSADSPAPPLMNIHADIDMADAAVHMLVQYRNLLEFANAAFYKPSPAVPPLNATPTAQRTATPTRTTNGNVDLPPPLPAKAAIHGAPARRYLNEKVTGVLMEGMKRIAVEQYVYQC